jgi:putative hydrolase of the HAD superfamily
MKNITTIFFDIDGTLIDHKGAQNKAVERIRKKYFFDIFSKKFQENWSKFTKKNWLLFEKGEINFFDQKIARIKDTWKSFSKDINDKSAEKIINEYASDYELNLNSFPHVLPTLRYLFKKKYRLGIISNGSNSQQIKKLKKINAYDLFEKNLIVISENIGYAKPDVRIFSHAQTASRTNPAQIAFFGDDIDTDILPTKNLLWQVILVDYANVLSHLNFPRILSFKEIKKILP